MVRRVIQAIRTQGVLGLAAAVNNKRSQRKIKREIYLRNLSGKLGLEIGGPSRLFRKGGLLPLYPVLAGLDGCNFSKKTIWEGTIQPGPTYEYQEGKKSGYQFISEAVRLDMIKPESYGFILASHLLEHIANPLKAIAEWLRVLKPDGRLVLVLPHKEGTFDHKRPVTTLAHLVSDYENNTDEADLTHLPEILELHDLSRDPRAGDFVSFKARATKNYENRCLHHHVFDTELAVAVLGHFRMQVLSVDPVLPFHIFLLGAKVVDSAGVSNERFLGPNAEYRFTSPFLSDRR
jgi:SAM-dependent methyltransferase